MTLLDLIKNDLGNDDKAVLSKIDLNKTNEEIIEDMTKVNMLKFKKNNHENQKAEQTQ